MLPLMRRRRKFIANLRHSNEAPTRPRKNPLSPRNRSWIQTVLKYQTNVQLAMSAVRLGALTGEVLQRKRAWMALNEFQTLHS